MDPLPGHAFRKYAFLPLSAYLNAIFSYGNLKSISYKKIHKNLVEAKICNNYPYKTGKKQVVIRANFCPLPNIKVFSYKKWTLACIIVICYLSCRSGARTWKSSVMRPFGRGFVNSIWNVSQYETADFVLITEYDLYSGSQFKEWAL